MTVALRSVISALRLASLAGVLALAAGCNDVREDPWRAIDPATIQTGASIEHDGMIPPTRMSPACSLLAGHIVAHGLYTAMIVGLALAYLRARRVRRAERAADPTAPLRDGPTVLQGVVDGEDAGEGPVVAVRIRQRGANHTQKNQPYHTWTETAREVTARPFVVRRDDGVRVRVEPPADVDLHHALSRTERVGPLERVKSAELVPGERVFVVGELAGAERQGGHGRGYRGTAEIPTLGPPRGRRMMVSTERPGESADTEARTLGRWLVLASALLAVTVAFATGPLLALSVAGEHVYARPVATQLSREYIPSKGGHGHWEPHYRLRAAYTAPDGSRRELTDECSGALYACVHSGGCNPVPFLVARGLPQVHQVGATATLPWASLWWIVGSLCFAAGLAQASIAASRRWYRHAQLTEHGNGHVR